MKRIITSFIIIVLLCGMLPVAQADFPAIQKDSLACVSTASGAENTVAAGTAIFSNRTYTFTDTMPKALYGLPFICTAIGSGVTAEVTRAGKLYIITQSTASGQKDSKQAFLEAAGFVAAATMAEGTMSASVYGELVLMVKEVTVGETISYAKWGVMLAKNGEVEAITLNTPATVVPTDGAKSTVAANAAIYSNRSYTFGGGMPSALYGRTFLCGSISSGVYAEVTSAGWIYVLTQSTASGKKETQQAALEAIGFTVVTSMNEGVMSSSVYGEIVLMGKEVDAGEIITYEKWGVLLAEIDEAEMEEREGTLALQAPEILINPTAAEYQDGNRAWQGIPGIAKDDESGRLWAVWYSGGNGEGAYNWPILYTSTTDGASWSGPKVVVDPAFPVRAYDANLWIDPQGRMWFFWNQSYEYYDGRCGVWAMVTEDPSSENPTWSAPRRLADGIMMNDPIVINEGAETEHWILPIALWNTSSYTATAEHPYNNAWVSYDRGENWSYLGSVTSTTGSRSADENMIIEQDDGTLRMLIRTGLGIEESYSSDGGNTWTDAVDANLSKTVSRFYIGRLSSGNQLLIYHDSETGTRENLTAALSTDGGKTWAYKLLLDARKDAAYPDAYQDADGNIYIIYDYDRKGSMDI
ncbi:MAG: exo-alpha-sialidase, partial [Clostridia bacterium]|nr:exo-alpha-sialidase [Clostridia bacterium]